MKHTAMISTRKYSVQGRTLGSFLKLALLACLLWRAGVFIAAGDFTNVSLFMAVAVVLGVIGVILSNWRSGVYLFLVWLLFEDLIRKYLGNNMLIYFGKDALVAVIYLSFLMTRNQRDTEPFRPPFKYALGIFFILAVVQIFNPYSPSLLYGLLGMKLYFYYIPLMFVGYALMRTEQDLRKFLVVNMGIAALIAAVGIIQAIFGAEFLNPHSGADVEELSHLVRESHSGIVLTRPCSVFVSDGRFGSYMLLAFILGVGTSGYLLLRTKGGRNIVFPALALVGLAAVMIGSRGAIVFTGASLLILSIGLLWGAPRQSGHSYRLFKTIRRSLVVIALALAVTTVIFPQQVGSRLNYYAETLLPWSPYYELDDRVGDYPMNNFLSAFSQVNWLIGHGTGTASLGGQYVTRIMGAARSEIAVENGWGSLVLEFGILGLLLWLAWTVALIAAATKVVLRLKGTWAFPIALSIFWFSFLLLLPFSYAGINQYQNFVFNAYLWLLVGVLFRLPSLVKQDAQATAESTCAA
jgi:hypothetical protein